MSGKISALPKVLQDRPVELYGMGKRILSLVATVFNVVFGLQTAGALAHSFGAKWLLLQQAALFFSFPGALLTLLVAVPFLSITYLFVDAATISHWQDTDHGCTRWAKTIMALEELTGGADPLGTDKKNLDNFRSVNLRDWADNIFFQKGLTLFELDAHMIHPAMKNGLIPDNKKWRELYPELRDVFFHMRLGVNKQKEGDLLGKIGDFYGCAQEVLHEMKQTQQQAAFLLKTKHKGDLDGAISGLEAILKQAFPQLKEVDAKSIKQLIPGFHSDRSTSGQSDTVRMDLAKTGAALLAALKEMRALFGSGEAPIEVTGPTYWKLRDAEKAFHVALEKFNGQPSTGASEASQGAAFAPAGGGQPPLPLTFSSAAS